MLRRITFVWLASTAIVGASMIDRGNAQTQLPGIVVTSPSPIAKPTPQPAPVAAPAPAATTAAAPQAPPPAAAPAPPIAQLPGTIIVEDAFVPVTVVTSREIDGSQASAFGDAIATKPGVTTSNFAPGASRPIIRGLDNYRVRVQENGIGSHDVSALSEDHAVPIDPLAAEQIEIVRGPATLRYGSQAIGGVVSANNSRIPEQVPVKGVRADVRGGFNSVDRGRDGAFVTEAGAGNFVVHADGHARDSGDYRTPQGRQANSFVQQDGYSLGGSYVFKDGYFGVAYTRFNSLYGIPGVEAAEEKLRIDMRQEKVTSKGEWRVRDFGVEAIRYWFGSSNYKHDEVAFNAVDGIDEIGSTFKKRENEGRVEIQHMPVSTMLGRLTGAVGVQAGRNTLSAGGEGGELLAPNNTRTVAGFIFEELQATRNLRFQIAGRIEQAKVDGTAAIFPADFLPAVDPDEFSAQRTFKPASASFGVLYELPFSVVARATAQYVERAPDVAELFSKGPHEATATFEIGDPNLTKERGRTAEIGLKRAKGAFRFDASAYYTKFDGFIFKRLTGNTCGDDAISCIAGPGEELDQIVYSQRDATFRGVELVAEKDIAPIWRGVWGIDGQYDFVRATFADGSNVPRIPPHRAGAGLYYRDAAWRARVGFLHAFRQDDIAANETETSGYTLLNAELSYTFKIDPGARLSPEFTIGIKGNNLLDDDVRNHVSFKKDEVLLPGRNFGIYGRIKLN